MPNEEALNLKIRGDAYVKEGKYDEAIQCYEYAIHLDPEYLSAWNNLGYAYLKSGQVVEAKKVREKINKIKRKQEKPKTETAVTTQNAKDTSEDPNELKYKGDQYIKTEQYEEAIKCYQKAVNIDPYFKAVWNNLGFSYFKLGRHEEAKKCKDKIKAIEENQATSLNKEE